MVWSQWNHGWGYSCWLVLISGPESAPRPLSGPFPNLLLGGVDFSRLPLPLFRLGRRSGSRTISKMTWKRKIMKRMKKWWWRKDLALETLPGQARGPCFSGNSRPHNSTEASLPGYWGGKSVSRPGWLTKVLCSCRPRPWTMETGLTRSSSSK